MHDFFSFRHFYSDLRKVPARGNRTLNEVSTAHRQEFPHRERQQCSKTNPPSQESEEEHVPSGHRGSKSRSIGFHRVLRFLSLRVSRQRSVNDGQ